MKICIIGGLGYIGAALIDTFRESDDEVVVVDKDFIPQRIAGLPKNCKFVQADINCVLDIDGCIMKPWNSVLAGADVIYHLASPVAAESTIYKEAETWQTIKEATLDLALAKPEKCLFVFASTANVFGGLLPSDKHEDLTEEDSPKPIYPYACSKLATEKELIANDDIRNVIICRFGTAYGYSDGIRLNLVSNIMFKKMLLGENIEVYGDGSNFRPFCHVRDHAGAMRFLVEQMQKGCIADKEVFHVVQKNLRIGDLANLLASFNPKCGVVHPADKPASFMSYALSSKKLTDLGFEFRENLKDSTEEMLKIFGACR